MMVHRQSNKKEGFMKLPKLKKWQWVLVVLVVLYGIGSVLPDSTTSSTTEPATTSPAWLLLIFPIILMFVLIGRIRKRRDKSELPAATPADALRDEIEELQAALDFFGNHEGQFDEAESSGIVARRDEHVIAVVSEVGLIESRRGPTQFQGGSTGVSFRLSKRISIRQSGMRGKAIPGEESPTIIDTGRFIVTDQRAVFVGGKQSREFDWDKLLSYEIQPLKRNNSIIYLPVSNRQKVSGVAADTASMESLFQRVAFGVAVATGRKDRFIETLKRELAEAEDD